MTRSLEGAILPKEGAVITLKSGAFGILVYSNTLCSETNSPSRIQDKTQLKFGLTGQFDWWISQQMMVSETTSRVLS